MIKHEHMLKSNILSWLKISSYQNKLYYNKLYELIKIKIIVLNKFFNSTIQNEQKIKHIFLSIIANNKKHSTVIHMNRKVIKHLMVLTFHSIKKTVFKKAHQNYLKLINF